MKEKKLASIVLTQISIAAPDELAKLDVNTLARLHGVSVPNLSRAFKKYHYFTLCRYLELIKFWRFESLIKSNPDMMVKEALEILDIRSSSHFCRRYKEQKGITPGQMVQKCKIEREQAARAAA